MINSTGLDRRNLLSRGSGLATASLLLAASGPAFAQTMSGGAAGYVKHTLMWGTLSKQISTMALSKATHPQLHQFAQFEVEEQTTVAQTLTNMTDPPPAPLDQMQQSVVTKLQGVSGKSFDTAYIQAQIQGHQKLLQIQQDYLSSSPSDLDKKHIAMLAVAVIHMHLTMLNDLSQMSAS